MTGFRCLSCLDAVSQIKKKSNFWGFWLFFLNYEQKFQASFLIWRFPYQSLKPLTESSLGGGGGWGMNESCSPLPQWCPPVSNVLNPQRLWWSSSVGHRKRRERWSQVWLCALVTDPKEESCCTRSVCKGRPSIFRFMSQVQTVKKQNKQKPFAGLTLGRVSSHVATSVVTRIYTRLRWNCMWHCRDPSMELTNRYGKKQTHCSKMYLFSTHF